MSVTQVDIDRYITTGEAEGLYVEFKRGAALTVGTDQARTELVKDCTGFANADGGLILYGIAEAEVGGVKVAAGLDPILDARATRDWVGEVLRSNSSPPLHRFEVTELPQPGGGRVVAIEIQAASTAHQSLRDYRYYQRAGASTAPMVDFQVRDVMARRAKPDAAVTLHRRNITRSAALHRHAIEIDVENVGSVTLEKWWLDVELPGLILRDTRNPGYPMMQMQANYHRLVKVIDERARVSFGDPWQDGERCLIHPGQVLRLDRNYRHFSEIFMEVDHENFERVHGLPLSWTLYFNNHAPKKGEVPFEEWCTF